MQLAIAGLERAVFFRGAQAHGLAELVPAPWVADATSALVCPVRDGKTNRFILAALAGEEGRILGLMMRGFSASRIEPALHRAAAPRVREPSGVSGPVRQSHRACQPFAAARPPGAGSRAGEEEALVRSGAVRRPGPLQARERHARTLHRRPLLAEASRRLSGCVRGGDTVGRISGDEFGLILADLARPDDAALVCAQSPRRA